MSKKKISVTLAGLLILLSTTFCILTRQRPDLNFLPDNLPAARVGVPFKVDILVGGNVTPVGNYSIADGNLSPGLHLVVDENLHTANISGTPTQTGTFQFTVSVWCYGTNVSGQTGEKKYTLVVGE